MSVEFLTGTDLEPWVLSALSDGRAWRTEQLYQYVRDRGILGRWDYARIPTTRGYELLKEAGFETKGLSLPTKDQLVGEHSLPNEVHYKNAVRYALRQLKRKGSVKGDGKGLNWAAS